MSAKKMFDKLGYENDTDTKNTLGYKKLKIIN